LSVSYKLCLMSYTTAKVLLKFLSVLNDISFIFCLISNCFTFNGSNMGRYVCQANGSTVLGASKTEMYTSINKIIVPLQNGQITNELNELLGR